MVAPQFKKATNPDVDLGNSPVKYGAPDIAHAFNVLDGTHASQRLQAIYIEGSYPLHGDDAIVKEQPLGSRDYYAYAANTGSLITSSVGTNSNASAIIKAAIDHIVTGTIFVRNGTYDFRTTLSIPDNISIIGESRFGTIFHSTASMGPDTEETQIVNARKLYPGNQNIVLANLTLDHKDASSVNHDSQVLGEIQGGAVINFAKVHDSIVFNCRIKDGKKFTMFWESAGGVTPEVNRHNIVAHNIILARFLGGRQHLSKLLRLCSDGYNESSRADYSKQYF
jgi:hypothetical protein